jgi:hypothetical protein
MIVGLMFLARKNDGGIDIVCGITMVPVTDVGIVDLDQAGALALALMLTASALIPEDRTSWKQGWGLFRRRIARWLRS